MRRRCRIPGRGSTSASGVTTIRTTGGRSPYAEINTRENINRGRVPGPRIHVTAPYITGAEGGGSMAIVKSPEAARRFVAYWAAEGATWLKAYTNIRRAELKAAIKEAHKRGVKVTGHLCSVSFREAVALGIDNLEHGMLDRVGLRCRQAARRLSRRDDRRDREGRPPSATAKDVIATMVKRGVSMTSTLAVYEPFVANRPTKDDRALSAMAPPRCGEAYLQIRSEIDSGATGSMPEAALRTRWRSSGPSSRPAGCSPPGWIPPASAARSPGYGDQRNYELFIEAGFTPEQAVQIMTPNGARILGVDSDLGTVEKGKMADLVVLKGDLPADPAVIRGPALVFKDGIGYDSAKLIASIEGRVGID